MERAILLISTLDTKAAETRYLGEQIRAQGANPLILDMSGTSLMRWWIWPRAE
jgi:uncharacterized protein (UPF0261 family)